MVAIEPMGEDILGGQEMFSPPLLESDQFLKKKESSCVIFFELLVGLSQNFLKMLNTLLPTI